MFTMQWAKQKHSTLGCLTSCEAYHSTCLNIRVQHYTLVLPCPSIDWCPSKSNALNCLNDINLNYANYLLFYLQMGREESDPKCWAAPFTGTCTSPRVSLNMSCSVWHRTCFFPSSCLPCYTVSLDIGVLTGGSHVSSGSPPGTAAAPRHSILCWVGMVCSLGRFQH